MVTPHHSARDCASVPAPPRPQSFQQGRHQTLVGFPAGFRYGKRACLSVQGCSPKLAECEPSHGGACPGTVRAAS